MAQPPLPAVRALAARRRMATLFYVALESGRPTAAEALVLGASVGSIGPAENFTDALLTASAGRPTRSLTYGRTV